VRTRKCTATEPTDTRRIGRALLAFAALTCVASLSGCATRRAYEEAERQGSLAAYQGFLQRYPSASPYSEQAQQTLRRMSAAKDRLLAVRSVQVSCQGEQLAGFEATAQEVARSQGWAVVANDSDASVSISRSQGVTLLMYDAAGQPRGCLSRDRIEVTVKSTRPECELFNWGFSFEGSLNEEEFRQALQSCFQSMWGKFGIVRR